MFSRARVAILGTGNIGTDLALKVLKSPKLELAAFIGRNPDSKNSDFIKKRGAFVSSDGIHEIDSHPEKYDLIFDATSAQDHVAHNQIFLKHHKRVINLTPAKIGDICVPVINLKNSVNAQNINLISCGGQAALPILYAISNSGASIDYSEVINTSAAECAGPATRSNIDEYLHTTEKAIQFFTNSKRAKALLNLNPAIPQPHMQIALRIIIDDPDLKKITVEVNNMVKQMQTFMPGYQLIFGPEIRENTLVCLLKITGAGDYLPPFAGCFDIINVAAIHIAEAMLEQK